MPASVRGAAASLRRRMGPGGLAGETAWGVGLEVFGLVGTIVSFTLLGRTLGPEGYGAYASVYATIGPVLTLAGGGVTLALLQYAVRDQEPLDRTARSCLALSMAVGGVLGLVGVLVVPQVVSTLSVAAIGSLVIVEFVTSPLIAIAAATVQSGTGYSGAARIRLLLIALRLVALLVLFALGRLTVLEYGLVQLVTTTILAVLVLRNVGRRYGFTFTPGRIDLRHLRTDLSYSAAITAFAVQNDGDKAVLAANRLYVDTGLYSAAYRIALLGMVPVSSVVDVTHRDFLVDDGAAGRHLRLAARLSVVMSAYALVLIGAVYVAAPLLPSILGDDFEGSVSMLRWVSPLVLLRVLSMFPLNGLMGLGRTGLRTAIMASTAGLALLLYVVLVPRHGWEGAVAGTLIADTVLVVVAWITLVVQQRRTDRMRASGEVVEGDDDEAPLVHLDEAELHP